MLGKLAQKTQMNTSNNDFRESVVIIASNDLTDLVNQNRINNDVRKFLHENCYGKGSLPVEVYRFTTCNEHNRPVIGVKLVSFSKDQSCSILEWHNRFYEFIKFFIHEECISLLMAKYVSYGENKAQILHFD